MNGTIVLQTRKKSKYDFQVLYRTVLPSTLQNFPLDYIFKHINFLVFYFQWSLVLEEPSLEWWLFAQWIELEHLPTGIFKLL